MLGPEEISVWDLLLWQSVPCTCSCGGLSQWWLLAQACSHRCPWLGSVSVDVHGLGTLPQKSLALAYSLGDSWLVPCPAEVFGSVLLPQWLLTCTWSCEGCCLRPALAVVNWIKPALELAQVSLWKCSWLGPAPSSFSFFFSVQLDNKWMNSKFHEMNCYRLGLQDSIALEFIINVLRISFHGLMSCISESSHGNLLRLN